MRFTNEEMVDMILIYGCMQNGFLIVSIPPINPLLTLLNDFSTLVAFPYDNGFEAGA